MLAAKIDRLPRHADVLSKWPSDSGQSSLHLDTAARTQLPSIVATVMQRY